ncbi:MAG TPA: tRNA pseudouridine(55) synthase TruB [Candidatus Pygmaiobacter gallistercoris]|nr:tRNA pseudouridine(55) synthase TruB [Candidatus Pygmaiobacter gallistercoris]
MNGILIVDKPVGWTSFDVIAKLRGALHTRKIGHSGTLDPLATGVLPLFVGGAVKAVDLPQNHKKSYLATLRFGVHTPTGDLESEPDERREGEISRTALETVLPQLIGPGEQLPPMYSAVKVNGQPLYKAARAGRQVERRPRPVEIFSLDCIGPGSAPNEWQIAVCCSKGTYIRVLVEEIARRLGTVAVMSGLRRTASGDFTLEQAHTMEEILSLAQQGCAEQLLLPVDSVFAALPRLDASAKLAERLWHGAPTHLRLADGLYRVYAEGAFLGLAAAEEGIVRVKKLFLLREN